MDSTKMSVRILMFPWLGHGHIFPFLELAKRILNRENIYIYLCTTPINFSSIKNFIENNMLKNSMELLELHLQPTSELPPHYHTPKNLPPNLLPKLVKAFQTTFSDFENILSSLEPDLVIYDAFQPWAAKISSRHQIPAIYFSIYGAAALSNAHRHYMNKKHGKDENNDFPFPELSLKDYEKKSLDSLDDLADDIYDADQDFMFGCFQHSWDIVLAKTSRALEGKYIDYISSSSKKKLLPVGPLVTDSTKNLDDEKNSSIMQWLDGKQRRSTVYVSFGSECYLSEAEMEEMAKGLELSSANFIWVVRFPFGKENNRLEEALPLGFLEKVKDRGLIIEGWAPQANILAHPSVGAFISHCGWSSITESLFYGVPIIALPMQYEQPVNARAIVGNGFAVEIERDKNGVLSSKYIAQCVNDVVKGNKGEILKLRAEELSEKMRKDEEADIDYVVDQLLLLCVDNNQKKLQ